MQKSKLSAGHYLGYREPELARPYGRFFNPELGPLAPQVCGALDRSGVPDVLIPGIDQAASNLFGAEAVLENGFVLTGDGGMRVSVSTSGVTPAMVDWWFGWHCKAPAKYKLWHPQAHVHVGWREPVPAGATGRALYVGQTSIVDEYIGSNLVRAVAGGSEMRSRFWIGGKPVSGRNAVGVVAAALARRTLRSKESDARALLVHCAQEMPHLAKILPGLFGEFKDYR